MFVLVSRAITMLTAGVCVGYSLAVLTLPETGVSTSSATGVGPSTQVSDGTSPAYPVQTPSAPRSGGGQEAFHIDAQGHVVADAEIDGADLRVLIDTGATSVVLRESDARRAGYRLRASDFTVPVNTANGQTFNAPIVLRLVELGSIRIRNVPALVSRDDQLGVNLLGMSFLSRLDGFRFEDQRLILEN